MFHFIVAVVVVVVVVFVYLFNPWNRLLVSKAVVPMILCSDVGLCTTFSSTRTSHWKAGGI